MVPTMEIRQADNKLAFFLVAQIIFREMFKWGFLLLCSPQVKESE